MAAIPILSQAAVEAAPGAVQATAQPAAINYKTKLNFEPE